jgi:hypothetical protein
MKIKKQKQNLLINTDNKNVLLYNNGDLNITEYSAVVNFSDRKENANNVISIPGEYEIEDILYSVFAFGDNLDHPDILFLDSNENIRVLYVLSNVENIDKSIIDKLPNIDIVIAHIDDTKIVSKLQIVSDIEPNYFIPLVDKSRIEEISKEMGIANIEQVTTLNVNSKDIDEESSDLKVYLLNN